MRLQPIEPYMETRPWGSFTKFVENAASTVKIITIDPGQELSLQYHNHRDEFWYVISGNGIATVGNELRDVKAGDTCFIERKVNHRIKSIGEPLVFLELAIGDFDEEDIVRLEDDYNRLNVST